jgi:hypothetical protein
MRLDDISLEQVNGYLYFIHETIPTLNSLESRTTFWLEKYSSNHEEMQLSTALSLIHPIFHERNTGESLGKLRGSREFNKPVKFNKCQIGTLISDIVCMGSTTEADHCWPYSLGGPTLPTNLCELCQKCNGQKSDSIALYNWNLKVLEIVWLVDMLRILEEAKTIAT